MDLKKLDYSVKTPQERKALVEQIVKDASPNQLTEKYIEILSNYIIMAMDKEEKKKKEIMTDNRLITINKRETSYQGLVSKFENGEDGLYNITIENDKNILLTPKVAISPKDVAEIPALADLKESIESVKRQEKKATGKNKYKLKKMLIEMYQEQYTIKNMVKQPIFATNIAKSFVHTRFDEHRYCATDKQLDQSDVYIIDVAGLQTLLELKMNKKINIPFVAFYLQVPEEERIKRMSKRGDSERVIKQRIEHDRIAFQRASELCEYTIDNIDSIATAKMIYSYVYDVVMKNN